MRRRASLFVFFAITIATVACFDTTFLSVFRSELASGGGPAMWYQQLVKPDWAPPFQLLAVGWLVSYLLIAVAGWIVWHAQGLGLALFLWFVQLGLGAAWPFLMFECQRIDLALNDAVALWLAIAAFVFFAWRLRKAAAVLFVPYGIFIAYVVALNLAMLQLNA